jgi:peptidyl-tRNA hydrolase, PTH1 family
MSAIRLIVGLGNPGPGYARTRHNVGARYLEHLAARQRIALDGESRFKARIARTEIDGCDVRLVVPTTYMNLSGQAVGAIARFYKLVPADILVVHDEMAFAPGVIRLKHGGGANGHNGLIDIIAALGNDAGFLRLRIGVGHPGHASLVTAHLTSQRMPEHEVALVEGRFADIDDALPLILRGEVNKAMNALHAPPADDSSSTDHGNT